MGSADAASRPEKWGPPLHDSLGAYAAKRLFEGFQPGFAYWEPPTEPWESDWTVVVGDETEADAEDPSCFQINRLDTLRTAHPRLAELFRAGVYGAYEWDTAARRYRPVSD